MCKYLQEDQVVKDAHYFANINPGFILSIKDEDLFNFYEQIRIKNAALGDSLECFSELIDSDGNTISRTMRLESLKRELINLAGQAKLKKERDLNYSEY